MTRINKLVLHGFKSFAKRTELVFGDHFNCVLGPNGAGKSNVLDALCFVLGKSSAKALRTEKAANLIYNGGKSKKPAKEAEVSIFFDNQDKTFPTDAPEVKITRIVRESGQSIYKINNEKRTREQVLELLSLAKVNPDGYNIILQGDIVQFVEMSPDDRRLLVEEISGISIYEDKKQKAINELSKVEEHLKEAEIVMKERETHLHELRKERDQAMKFKDLRDKIQQYQGSLLWKQIRANEEERDSLAGKLDRAQQALQKKQEEIRAGKELIAQKRAEIDRINKDIEQKGEKEQVAVHKEVEKIRVELAMAKNRIESVKAEIEKIKARKAQLQVNCDEAEAKIAKMRQEQETLQESIKHAESQQADIDKRIAEFKKKNKLEDAQDIDKQIDALDKQAEEQQKAIQALRQQQQELLREKDKLEFQISAVDEKIAKVLAVEEEHRDAIAALKQQKSEFKNAALELNQAVNKDSELAAQLQNARKSVLASHEELAKMKARNATIREAHAGDAALRNILELRKKNPAIYGTVAELGNVGAKHTLALEVAAGARIKSVIVADDKTAAELIRYLRESKLGVVTFLPLNKIKAVPRQAELDKIANANGAHGYAVDLVEYDPKFKNVFSYVFGNTIVVENLDVARRIGIGNAKMATLDGDLTELSGAMQGGFRPKARGVGFVEKELTAEIGALERKTLDTEQLVVRLEKDKQQNEELMARLRELKANLEGEIIKTEKSLNLQEGDIDVSKKEKQELQKALRDAEQRGEEVLQQIADANEQLADNRIKRQELRNRITQLRNPALLAELNAFEQKKKELREEAIKQDTERKAIEGQIKNILVPERENIAKVVKQHTKESEDFQRELAELKDRIAGMEQELREREKQEKLFYEQFKDLFTQRTKLDEEIKRHEGKIEELQEQERKSDHGANTAQLELAQVKATIAGLQQAFEEFKEIEVIKNRSEAELRKDIGTAEGVITRMGSINMKALEIYEGVEREYHELLKKKEKLLLEKEDVLVMMNEIELKKKDLFMKTFDVVNHNFKTIFTTLSTKGEADLVLENPDVPFVGGLLIKVRLTGSKFMDIRSLSGGEKTLTALAFIFAIQEHEPASFYVLDEVDAALDKHNSEKLGLLIKKYAEKAQYLMISHNDAIITVADLLYGVSMDEHGMSNVVTLKI